MSKIVSAARRYTGTRFRHRGRSATGLDCAGLVWLAYHDLGVTLPDFRLYGPEPHEDGLVRHITEALGEPAHVAPVSQDDLQVGDVIVFRFITEPHHVALVTDYIVPEAFGMIHADGWNKRVVEHRMSPDMLPRITHVWRRPV